MWHHVISCDIMWYHVISWFMIPYDITWYTYTRKQKSQFGRSKSSKWSSKLLSMAARPPQAAGLGPGKGTAGVMRSSAWAHGPLAQSGRPSSSSLPGRRLRMPWRRAHRGGQVGMGIPFIFSRYSGRRAYYRCAAHINCAVRLFASKSRGGWWSGGGVDRHLQGAIKENSEEERSKKRKNSPLGENQAAATSRTPRLCDTDMIYDDIDNILRYWWIQYEMTWY